MLKSVQEWNAIHISHLGCVPDRIETLSGNLLWVSTIMYTLEECYGFLGMPQCQTYLQEATYTT